jgi:hypothetical protein
VKPRIGWGQPLASWDAPGWAPLVDPGPRSLQRARTLGRWWWPTVAVGGFLAVVMQVVDQDEPAPGLSGRGLITIALAAALVALLTIHRRNGPRWLARAVAEYAVVALLATLLAAADAGGGIVGRPPAEHAKPAKANHAKVKPTAKPKAEASAGDDQPALLRVGAKLVRAVTGAARAVAGAVRWLVDLWRQADQQASKGEAMVFPPRSATPSAPPTWRSRS